MKEYQPDLDRIDLEYVSSIISFLDELSSKFDYMSTAPISVYSDADPIGYIDSRFSDDKTKHYFVAGDRYKEED